MPGGLGTATSVSDASRFNARNTKVSSEEGPTSPSDDGSTEKMPDLTTRKRLSGLTGRNKAKIKQLFKLHGAKVDEQSEDEDEGPLDSSKNDPAFNSSQLMKRKRLRPATADKTLGAIQCIGKAVIHPINSAKSTATRTTACRLSKAERPYLSQEADIEFLQAHDNLKRAKSTSSSKQGTPNEEQDFVISGYQDKIREMEEHRERLRVAWTTSRHVVRVVPKRYINFPNNEYFVQRDERGDFVRYEWLKWLGYVSLPSLER